MGVTVHVCFLCDTCQSHSPGPPRSRAKRTDHKLGAASSIVRKVESAGKQAGSDQRPHVFTGKHLGN